MKGLHNNNNFNIGDSCKGCPRFWYFWLLKIIKKKKILKYFYSNLTKLNIYNEVDSSLLLCLNELNDNNNKIK